MVDKSVQFGTNTERIFNKIKKPFPGRTSNLPMKTKHSFNSRPATQWLQANILCLLTAAVCLSSHAQSTAFTYQGRLEDGGSPASGNYDLRLALFNAVTAGTQQGALLTNAATAVSNGLFTVTLDFGNQFPGANRWLEIAVRTNGGGAFSTLAPRQAITATPYAVQAATAATASSVAAANISGIISSNNLGAGSITTTMLATGAVGSNQLAAGAVTTTALANGAVTATKVATVTNWFALTIANPTPENFESFGNAVAAVGSDRVLIGAETDRTGALSAGAAYLFNINGSLLTTFTNPTPLGFDNFGYAVAAMGNDRVLIGAFGDDMNAPDAGAAYLFSTNGTLLTTFVNPSPADGNNFGDNFGYAVAAMGNDRVLIGAFGDDMNATNAGAAYLFSTNGTLLTTFANPTPALNDNFGNAVAAVGSDRVLIGAKRDDTGAIRAGAAYLFSANGGLLTTFTNPTPFSDDLFGYAVAAMGNDRVLIGANSDDFGAQDTGRAYLFSANGTLLATFNNPTPQSFDSFGSSVAAVGSDRVLIGAEGDNTGAPSAGAAYLFSTNGTLLATINNPTPFSDDLFGDAVAAVGSDRVLIGAPSDNTVASGAGAAYLFSTETFTDGLVADAVRARSVTTASLEDGAVTAVKLSGPLADSQLSTNVAFRNTPQTFKRLTVAGAGAFNSPNAAAIILDNTTPVTGRRWEWHALDNGKLQLADFDAAATRLVIDTAGNVGIGTASPASALQVVGTVTATAFNPPSDRNLKENFAPVSPREVLDKVTALPISRWNFKGDAATPHVGPMAQDFHAAFGLGTDERHIATVDADGVALAAIQGLNEKVEARSKHLEAENAALKRRLEKLEALLEQRPSSGR